MQKVVTFTSKKHKSLTFLSCELLGLEVAQETRETELILFSIVLISCCCHHCHNHTMLQELTKVACQAWVAANTTVRENNIMVRE